MLQRMITIVAEAVCTLTHIWVSGDAGNPHVVKLNTLWSLDISYARYRTVNPLRTVYT